MLMPERSTIRPSRIAGSWYPGTDQSLARAVDGYLAAVDQPPVEGDLMGLICPHAGFSYSGQTAAYAYQQLQGRKVNTVAIVGPSHRAWVDTYGISAEQAYETPLGLVPLDMGFIAALADRLPVQRISGDAEHALEIQLPFLQRILGAFSLVPILMSSDEPSEAERLAAALADTILDRARTDGQVLLIASSDLHHIEDYDSVVRRDGALLRAIAAFDLEGLVPLLMDRDCTVCGGMPILAVLNAARALGSDSVDVLHHTNSGDVAGRRRPGDYTVGYMAAAIYRSQ